MKELLTSGITERIGQDFHVCHRLEMRLLPTGAGKIGFAVEHVG